MEASAVPNTAPLLVMREDTGPEPKDRKATHHIINPNHKALGRRCSAP